MSCKSSLFQKVLTALILVNSIGLLGIVGGGFYGYKYVTSGNFEKLIKSKIMGDIQSALPTVIEDKLPSITGESIPFR
tara:strand:- start:423 stop:656 length:234 start_codon:yes stop_codon:yes gene_type:complete